MLFFAGAFIYSIPHIYEETSNKEMLSVLTHIFQGVGGILLATSLIEAFFQYWFQQKFKDQVTALKSNILNLQKTVDIASGALEAGISAVYASRSKALQEIEEKIETLINTDPKTRKDITISILGISLGDMLCPHGRLHNLLKKMLKLNNATITMVILDKKKKYAKQRAMREEWQKFMHLLCKDCTLHTCKVAYKKARNANPKKEINPDKFKEDHFKGQCVKKLSTLLDKESSNEIYLDTDCHNELKTATNKLQNITRIKDKNELTVNGYTYDLAPTAFIFVLDDTIYVENYHLAGRGGESPLLKISKTKMNNPSENSHLFDIYTQHLETIINLSNPIDPLNNEDIESEDVEAEVIESEEETNDSSSEAEEVEKELV